jgi:UDP:flavonoid glycosyltransferase YjiC (YdhE family)
MKIVLATFGSLGDLHPMIALGIELRRRGHAVAFAAMEAYREKIDALGGFEFHPMRPDINPDDREFAREVMEAKTGTEKLIRGILMPNLRAMYEDLEKAVKGADLLISGDVVFIASSLAEKTGIKWITATLAPASFLSAHDPFVPPTAQWLGNLRFLGKGFHKTLFSVMRRSISHWYEPYRKFRRELGLSENHDPIFDDKYSRLLHLALFSKVLGKPQPDWHRPTLQCGFCFYDGQDDIGQMPENLTEFLDAGEPPIVFTLGSAAVMDAGDFFEESAKAARILQRRAVLLYGVFNDPPQNLDENVVGFDYAPYSKVFPRAACVVHQGGVGTCGQILRAGVPHLIMPYSHDQPDNAARCARLGVARVISRSKFTAENAARALRKILSNDSYKIRAAEAKRIVEAERGTQTACDAIENIMTRQSRGRQIDDFQAK